MTMNNPESQAGVGRKSVIFMLVGGLVAIFLTAFAYRIQNPSIVVSTVPQDAQHGNVDQGGGQGAAPQGQMPPASGGMGQGMGGDMADIRRLMMDLREKPGDTETLKNLGEAFLRRGAYQDALGFLEQAVIADPSDPQAYMLLGMTKFGLDQYAEAAQYFEGMLKIQPDSPDAGFNLGMLYKHFLAKPQVAEGHFQAVLDSQKASEDLKAKAAKELEK
jgi:tetratricopeptide (TPR) repeat protein